MEVNSCCKIVAKTIIDKMKSGNKIMVAIINKPDGEREIRLYTPNGKACGSKSMTLAEFDDLTGQGITGIVEVNVDLLVRNQ